MAETAETPSSPKDTSKSAPESVIGIDFGTQRVVVAIASPKQEFLPKIVQNNLSNHNTPNVVSFKDQERSIGEEAQNQFVSFPKGTISQVKRLLGKSWNDPVLQAEAKRLPYSVKENNDNVSIEVAYRSETASFTPVQIAAMVLSKVKWFVEKREEPVTDCVISVPSSFSEAQRTAISDAARIAGLNVIGLVHENTAAALTYGFSRNPEEGAKKHVLLLDQGHSYFSAQVIEFEKDKLKVLSSVSDDDLGARVFDHALFDQAAEQFKSKTSLNVHENAKAVCRLLQTAEKSKQILSTIPNTDFTVECLMNDRDVNFSVSRGLLEDSCKDQLNRLTSHIQKVVESSGVALDNMDVEIIGGGLRIPLCQEKIRKAVSPKDLRFSLDSAHCVAIGAALMGKILKNMSTYSVTDPFNVQAAASTLSEEQLEKAKQVNSQLIEDDKLVSRKKDAKNAIEAYIYSTRGHLSDTTIGVHFSDAEKQSVSKLLEEAENWVFDESDQFTYDVIEEKLKQLKDNIASAAGTYSQHLLEKEAARLKAQQEAEEYARLHPVSESTHKERREPRTKGEKMEAAQKRKTQGNTLFKDGDYENAVVRYSQVIGLFGDIFDLSPDEQKEVDELKLSSYLNLGACWLKLKKYDKTKENCSSALKIDDKNVKALFRRGQANYYLREYEEAVKDLTAAGKLDPANSEVKKTLKTVQEKLKEQQDKEKKIYQKMFG
eukprot:TRINITY_DN3982_c2_g1_i3.p1 TRINITY_DN3982_c2_g1~~TRINITY_DN3982_c2_g1_i3.p1  ORF type:complete len:716 (-),score=200.35 TRINITY_DN3982_c2_g1_i3:18-2165(-)